MACRRPENNTWMSVPQFGGWDQKSPGATDYSVIFTQARADRKQRKADVRRSLGDEQELIAAALSRQLHNNKEESVPQFRKKTKNRRKKKKMSTYINCCIRVSSSGRRRRS